MIKSRKHQLVIALILACICVPVLSAEPNEPKTELKFEIRNELRAWVRNARNERGRGPIRPTHVAEFFRTDNYSYPSFSGTEGIKTLLKSSAGRSTSQKQRDLLATSDAFISMGFGEKVRNHRHFRLYAVSQDDAKKMVEAFIEISTNWANARMQRCRNEVCELEEEISQAKKQLPEKEADLEVTEPKYQNVKKRTHELSSDADASEEAKKTIREMNKTLDALSIEIAGIEAKLSAIEEYKSKKNVSIEGLAKLEQILSEQTIELVGALARKKAALIIRKREEEFYTIFCKWGDLNSEVHTLRERLSKYEAILLRVKERLANPTPEMLLPKVFQNKVTIYPVVRARE